MSTFEVSTQERESTIILVPEVSRMPCRLVDQRWAESVLDYQMISGEICMQTQTHTLTESRVSIPRNSCPLVLGDLLR